MIEVKVTITAPEISEAINNLAAAIGNRPATETVSKDANATQGVSITPVAPAQTQTVPAAPAVNPTTPVAQETVATAPTTSVPNTSPSDGKTYTKEELSKAGAALCEQGKMADLINLLAKYGVQSIVELGAEHYASIAAELKALGAKL